MNSLVSLVTGASSGIGEAFARALASRGHALVLTARRLDRLESLAAALRKNHGVKVHVVCADLSKPTGVDDLVRAVDALDVHVDVLINNAGFGSYGSFSKLPLERELEMVDLNVRAVVALTGAFLEGMLQRGRGTILQIASTTAFQPVPYMAVYGATKAFVLSHAEAVARECEGTGVRVIAICPGHTPTEFQERSGVHQRPTRTTSQSADAVVREALHAMDDGTAAVVVTGVPNKITTQLPRVVPRAALSWLVERAFRPRAVSGGAGERH
jgi:short-subunit dehydrogenase